jgi:hypothetical protein
MNVEATTKALNNVFDAQNAADDAIDGSLLHSGKWGKSGFYGVYPQGSGWIAKVRVNGASKATKTLGTYLTPKQAAWARYQHYREHNMPYGKLEVEIEKIKQNRDWRALGADKPEGANFAKAMAIWNLSVGGTVLPDLTDEDRHWETVTPRDAADANEHYTKQAKFAARKQNQLVSPAANAAAAVAKAKTDAETKAKEIAAFNALMTKTKKLPLPRSVETVEREANGGDRHQDEGGDADGGGSWGDES